MHFKKVTKIEPIVDDSDYYDLTIPDTHNYCLSNGMVVHNCGVGYSVQRHHVAQLPPIKKPKKYQRFLIGDSIAGWSDSVKVLMRAFLDPSKKTRPRFDFRDIREKGMPLITSGGKAPGPEPLKICLTKIEALLEEKQEGTQLTPLEVHDIACHLADAVLAGGIRRAAMISLFSPDDYEMMACKTGNWWELAPQRARANNSVVFNRNHLTYEQFSKYWDYLVASKSGEPGFLLTNDNEWGTNPCVTGDTLVPLADGSGDIKTIKEIADSAEDVMIYSLDDSGELSIRELRGTQVTRKNAPVYKVTLDNGQEIKATSNHRLRLKDGLWKTVGEIEAGDSLWIMDREIEDLLIHHRNKTLQHNELPIVYDLQNNHIAHTLVDTPIFVNHCEITGLDFYSANPYERHLSGIEPLEVAKHFYDNHAMQVHNNTSQKQDVALYANHKVVSVEYCGIEDVYDGIVNDTHNYFLLGSKLLQEKTERGIDKYTFINSSNCAEIGLQNKSFCNLTTGNANLIRSQDDLNDVAKTISFIGTLQAGYTDFYYLSPEWEQNAVDDALLGTSMTGWASGLHDFDLEEAAECVLKENERVANLIGINPAKRTNTTKPEGCLDPSTRVKTDKGILSLEQIFELNDLDYSKLDKDFYLPSEQIFVYDKDNELQMIEALYCNGESSEMYEIEFEDGLTVQCTGNHKFMMEDGTWKKASELLNESSDLDNLEVKTY